MDDFLTKQNLSKINLSLQKQQVITGKDSNIASNII